MDNFWYEYSCHNLPSNDHSVSHLTQCMLQHYLGKADQANCALKETENLKKNIPNIIDRTLNKD